MSKFHLLTCIALYNYADTYCHTYCVMFMTVELSFYYIQYRIGAWEGMYIHGFLKLPQHENVSQNSGAMRKIYMLCQFVHKTFGIITRFYGCPIHTVMFL